MSRTDPTSPRPAVVLTRLPLDAAPTDAPAGSTPPRDAASGDTLPADGAGPRPTAPGSGPVRGGRLSWAVVVSGPLLVVASELIAPRSPRSEDPQAYADFVLAHSGRLAASWLVGLLAAAALAAGFTVLATRLPRRGRVVGRIGAVLGVLGAVGLAGHMAVSLQVRDLLLADPTAVRVVAGTQEALASGVTVLLLVVGTTLGLIAMCVAAVRAGWARWWVVALAVAALVADLSPLDLHAVIFGGLAAVALAVVAAGSRRSA